MLFRSNSALDTLSCLNRPVVVGERITDHAQDCSEVALYSAPCAEILNYFVKIDRAIAWIVELAQIDYSPLDVISATTSQVERLTATTFIDATS